MRASLIQIAVDPDESVKDRRARAAALVVAQSGSDLVVLPELWPVGAFAYTAFEAEAEPLEGPTHQVMAKAAAEAGVWLHAGSFVERTDDGTLFNTSLVFSPEGERAAFYRKIHRFGFDQGEAVHDGRGRGVGDGRAAGHHAGPRDLLRPPLPRAVPGARRRGGRVAGRRGGLARMPALPLDAAEPRPVPWRTRRTSSPSGRRARTPTSRRRATASAADPWGEVLAEAGADEEILTVELDAEKVRTTREQFPALKGRRLGLASPL
ncbi:carbon-nitrogen family hydrolase [Streptomyces californicus]